MTPDNYHYRESNPGFSPVSDTHNMNNQPPQSSSELTVPAIDLTHPESLEDFVEAARGAFSQNTKRAIRADLRIFTDWCLRQGLAALPALPETIAAYIDAMADLRAPATVRRYVASVTTAHKAVGHGHTAKSPLVTLALQRMHRKNGRRQTQALGLTGQIRWQLMRAAGERLIDVRNCALLSVAYDTLLRRSELSALEVSDLFEGIEGGGSVLVRRSKTDQDGDGAMLYLAGDTVDIVRQWLVRSGIRSGRLFRSLRRGVLGDQLDPSQIPRIYKAMAQLAGLPPEVVAGLSGHSTRVGAAQDMIAVGIELPAILQAGRWKSVAMVNRYGERLLADRGGSAQLARLQRRE